MSNNEQGMMNVEGITFGAQCSVFGLAFGHLSPLETGKAKEKKEHE